MANKYFSGFRTDQFDDSCDENKETDLQDEDLIPTSNARVESSDSVTDSSEDAQDSTAAFPSDNSLSQNSVRVLKAGNGTVWKNITGGLGMGRAFAANLLSKTIRQLGNFKARNGDIQPLEIPWDVIGIRKS